ncbi:hypothetical protein R70723_19465 [Paenibacillus sp. FSL R7-0273]|uniref:endolytic transglycosylase MltG n=1 Tax=Paenibacillus sp. FSL R7-0273 TaxID=1536772 RepID=UPI0004F5AA6E|nr:endolytic transglycosylase MltG [Paenibacillus sp. FSL R7-0273]AIQ47833.1 hypothetical protein R70723_19465 [Paenibacillus sp. FSL R7-0273]OMF94612.1 hypothetical protein BK144_08820 [Paenibacillus sp. FSL R7-0273]
MMKNRSFMLGLGTGLIAGALLLQLMISGGAAPLTREELVRQAEQLNLTVTDPAAGPLATVEPDGADSAPEGQTGAAPGAATAAPAATPAPTSTPDAAVQPSSAAKPSTPAQPSQPSSSSGNAVAPAVPASPQTAAAGVIAVRIPSGSTLTQTAQLLAKAGIISDQAGFLETAIDRKINTKIQSGSYNFIKGESVNSIIEKLITVK